ncbi:MAG: DUF4382 domain-containing protein [Bacteroidia bacterium]|nr:DUF4382 domain-containing protein [Bacteroidia bacterium]
MKQKTVLFTMLFALLATFSCESDKIHPDNTAKSYLQIRLTDNPLNVDEVNIDLLQVSIKTKNTQGFVPLNTYPGIYDLLKYQAGQDTLIVNDTLPPGEIQEVRLLLGTNNSVMVDSVLYPLKVPSGMQSGIKIKFTQILVQDSLTNVTLDFDAEKSVVDQGNGGYLLKPVITAIL